MYTHNLQTGVVTLDADGTQVAPFNFPPTQAESAYQAWMEAGNEATPFVAQAVDASQLEADVGMAVQLVLDTQAQTMGYDSILSAVTYFDSTVPSFAADAARLKPWRDACWAYCYALLAQAQAGSIPIPTVESVVAGLPALGA